MAEVSAKSVPAVPPADSSSPKPAIPKMSFASVSRSSIGVDSPADQSKVAAMAASPKPHVATASGKVAGVENRPPLVGANVDGKQRSMKPSDKRNLDVLQESVAALNIAVNSSTSAGPGPVIASADTELEQPQPVANVLRHDDEKTHLSFISNPTMSTDMRSVVSGTAFNMDEKESIRPDESASVKGIDESDSASGQGSGGLQSQVASEAGKDGFRDQFQEVSTAKMALPLTANLVGRVPDDVNRSTMAPTMEFQPQGPDEKLLDALDNPKDRIFLLQLEQQVITFISNTAETTLSLPPQNSFCRLLAHRLGDYYSLAHTADASLGSVKLAKTEATRLPPSLKDITSPSTPESGAPQQQPALKIMRRNKQGAYGKDAVAGDETVTSSAMHSQAGSDTGASGTDLQRSPSKNPKNMTREEREAHYAAARERIFGDMEETKPSTETSTAASRASSTTGGKPKKSKNRPKNDDFEPRSMYMNMGYQQQQQQPQQQQQTGYGYSDRHHQQQQQQQQQQMYGYPPQNGPGLPPHVMSGGYNDNGISHQPSFPQQSQQAQHSQMQTPQMPMGSVMPGYSQPNYGQPPMYSGAYGYGGQGQPMAPMPMPMQQQYYPGPDQGGPYNNMMGGPMMNHNQPPFAQGYQAWNSGMPMPYGGQDQAGYFPQPSQSNNPGNLMYQKTIEGTTPPAARFNPEYHIGAAPHSHQPQQQHQQQGQWQPWQGPPQYGQFANAQSPWQIGQPGLQGSPLPPNGSYQPIKMNAYSTTNMNQGKTNKKGGHKTGGKPSELGKYDTSSLPPKPPAPVQGEQ